MSLNMHPRNIYKKPPDYTYLAIKYPEFRSKCKLNLNGEVTIDINSAENLKTLTKYLLLEDFNINIEFPGTYLVPTLPLRLNYILWIEDIINTFQLDPVSGIDIGCGASCIYSLLAARKNSWNMTALECNMDSYNWAKKNVASNNMENLISVFFQENNEIIFKNMIETFEKQYDFCLCNPPFFDNCEKFSKKRKNMGITEEVKPLVRFQTGIDDELFCEGGELAFAERILKESIQFSSSIRIFSTMFGRKVSFLGMLKLLKKYNITNLSTTSFSQGRVTRWAIAWTFQANLILKLVPTEYCYLKEKLYAFQMKVSMEIAHKYIIGELKKMHTEISVEKNDELGIKTIVKLLEETFENTNVDSVELKNSFNNKVNEEMPLVFQIEITKFEENSNIQFKYLKGFGGRSSLHQIYQQIKNKFKHLNSK